MKASSVGSESVVPGEASVNATGRAPGSGITSWALARPADPLRRPCGVVSEVRSSEEFGFGLAAEPPRVRRSEESDWPPSRRGREARTSFFWVRIGGRVAEGAEVGGVGGREARLSEPEKLLRARHPWRLGGQSDLSARGVAGGELYGARC